MSDKKRFAVLVSHHDEPYCFSARLLDDEFFCPVCRTIPEYTIYRCYCPDCDILLDDEMRCEKCGNTFINPRFKE